MQLVGTALFVIVKSELTAVMRNVEGTSRKVRTCYSRAFRSLLNCHSPDRLEGDVWQQGRGYVQLTGQLYRLLSPDDLLQSPFV